MQVHIDVQNSPCFSMDQTGSDPHQISNRENAAANNYNSVLLASGRTNRRNARRPRRNTSLPPIRNPINFGTDVTPVGNPRKRHCSRNRNYRRPKLASMIRRLTKIALDCIKNVAFFMPSLRLHKRSTTYHVKR